MQQILDGLTEPQRAAVMHTEGPLLVLAAAGSGKTRVITRRIAYILSKGVPPWAVLALTFTNKAAGEMRERVSHVLQDTGLASRWSERALRSLTVSTFHALCARLLRRYAAQAGLSPEFTIFDDSDQMLLVKRVISDLQLSTSNWPPRSVLAAISDAKNELLDCDAYAARAADFYTKTIAKAYRGYETGLKQANAVDFDDLLVRTAILLKKDASVRAELQDRWRYILIDEYQDTNHAQFTIASLLAGEGKPSKPVGSIPPGMEDDLPGGGAAIGPNICVVGDPDQAI